MKRTAITGTVMEPIEPFGKSAIRFHFLYDEGKTTTAFIEGYLYRSLFSFDINPGKRLKLYGFHDVNQGNFKVLQVVVDPPKTQLDKVIKLRSNYLKGDKTSNAKQD